MTASGWKQGSALASLPSGLLWFLVPVFPHFFQIKVWHYFRHGVNDMKLPGFPFRKKAQKLSRQDEKIFAEASELAQLRLEQCIADLQTWVPTINDTLAPRAHRPLRKLTNLF